MGQLFGSESAYIIAVDAARAAVEITVAENEELLPRFDLRREAGKRDDEGEDATELGKRMHEADGGEVQDSGGVTRDHASERRGGPPGAVDEIRPRDLVPAKSHRARMRSRL